MLVDVLEVAGLDPSAVVGSLRAKTKSNFRAGMVAILLSRRMNIGGTFSTSIPIFSSSPY